MAESPKRRIFHGAARGLAVLLSLTPLSEGFAAGENAGPAAGGASERHAYTNRLIDSNDPYLLLHAHNPVDWYPWGPEALAKAKSENRPIFVSIGYSTCYWCHVAERTIYSDPAIAKLMNEWFINIKVDREQRPDLDSVYMLATQLITGHGGWPNNVFLTPELKPFFAGSYFRFRCIYGHCTQLTDFRRPRRFSRKGTGPIGPQRSVVARAASSERKLTFMDAMSELDAGNRNCRIGEGFEAFH